MGSDSPLVNTSANLEYPEITVVTPTWMRRENPDSDFTYTGVAFILWFASENLEGLYKDGYVLFSSQHRKEN